MEEKEDKRPGWYVRLIEEHHDLIMKIMKLRDFLNTHIAPNDLSCAARMLLEEQCNVMEKYRDVLYLRMCFARSEAALNNEDWIKEEK